MAIINNKVVSSGGKKVSKELKITPERIKKLEEGLESCGEAQQAIRDAFPEAFEEKKKEWVDVAEELTAQVYERPDGFAVNIYHNDLNVAFIDGDGICTRSLSGVSRNYRIGVKEDSFRILEKT